MTEIKRNQQSIPTAVESEVAMEDAVITANSKVSIVFKDDSTVKITEQSKLVIDSFVYDNTKQDAAKLGLKVALGTARFASGQINKHTPESLKIETPTATVGVRGTDFSLTVDELGRTLAILLPSCPVGFKDIDKDCKAGEIVVSTDAGETILNKSFQAATVNSREAKPGPAVIIKLDPNQINNLLILTPPVEIQKAQIQQNKKSDGNLLDINFLDQDFLNFNGLANELDSNPLDALFFLNILNSTDEFIKKLLPNYPPNASNGLKYKLNGSDSVTLYKNDNENYAQVTVSQGSSTTVKLNQGDNNMTQTVNRTGGTVITVTQGR